MYLAAFTNSDYIGRSIDSAIYIGLGIAILLVAPRQIRRKLESGKLTEAKAKSMLKVVWPLGCLMIGYGVFRIVAG
jgi:hypothetical protein